ncbi:DUF3139 domain-containing protein [Paenibacillus wynnii]|uniref:Uncharacterized protein n=1 Tax=Paenibacillus wynnii TaxID=268407 RepID=A0A098MDS2_9BACL|nr:DUF3139 domain-containing protein [Paenibacillus wynnii]KGE20136.1 hypothetical protein PWYN_12955 [Paenibacillus wynnii]
MHPITVIEITASVVFVIVIFLIALLLPDRVRKLSLITACSITVLLLVFFALRPYWIDYQVSQKTEQLNQYLEEKYPNQEWEISRQVGRQYNAYHLEVTFKNEKGWIYTYSVVNEKNIHQSAWMPPGGKFPDGGKHYEQN